MIITGKAKYIVNILTNMIIDYTSPQPGVHIAQKDQRGNGQWTDGNTSSKKFENGRDNCPKGELKA